MVRITNISQKSAGVLLTGPGGHKENNSKNRYKPVPNISQAINTRYLNIK